jgi:hypothetical protein
MPEPSQGGETIVSRGENADPSIKASTSALFKRARK